MTRLPIDSWNVKPRLDLPAYEMNEACPVTGSTLDLEDHHIFRRSFTALGKEDNRDLYWVETDDGRLLKNRVMLSPEAHARITTNRARLVYNDNGELDYVEGDETLNLGLRLKLMTPTEKVSKPRRKPKASTSEERKARVKYCISSPKDEENVLPELAEALREKLAPEMGWNEDVPSYFVWVAAAAAVLQS